MDSSANSNADFTTPTTAAPDMAGGFADPDWRGVQGEAGDVVTPIASLFAQAQRIEDWIRGGACYGWLDSYQARRAGFELQSIRAQLKGASGGACRCAIRSRLDRLDAMLRRARQAAWEAPDEP